MKKVVINSCLGGYGVSDKVAIEIYKIKNNLKKLYFYIRKDSYTDVKYLDEKDLIFDEYNFITKPSHFDIYVSPKYLGDTILKEQFFLEDTELLISLSMNVNREDKLLIDFIEKLGSNKCNGRYADLKIVEIPDDVKYEINNKYGTGLEYINII